MAQRVIIDSDPATGLPNRDVDDGLAYLVMLAAPQTKVEGITITFGNVGANVGYGVAKEILDLIHSDVPVFKGAQSKAEQGLKNPAVEFLMETVRANPGEISLLALGPLTNIATAVQLDPGFAPNLKELVIMGGSLRFWPFSYFGEFNFHQDGRAAAVVLRSQVRKTILTMDVCSQAVFRSEQLAMLKEHDSPVSKYLVQAVAPWLELNRKVFFKARGFFPWDVVAAAYLIDRTLFDANPYTLAVRESGLRSGNIYGCTASSAGDDSLNIPLKLDSVRFMKLLMDALLSY